MNQRFQDYATSGAFNLSLSRTQVSALSMLSEIGDAGCATFSSVTSLWKKGLVRSIQQAEDVPSGPVELTAAGHHAMKLVDMAGLTNSPPTNYDTALDDAHTEIQILSAQNRKLAHDNLEILAKLRAAEQYIDLLKSRMGSKKPSIMVAGYDPDGGRCTCEIEAFAREATS